MFPARELGNYVMPDQRYRVLVLATHVVQYASPLYRALAKDPRLETLVGYCSLQGSEPGFDREFGVQVQWDVPLLDGYKWVHVPNRSLRPRLGHFFGLWNPGLWKLIRKGNFDAIVIYAGYMCASFWLAVLAARLSHTAFLFGTDATSLAPRDARSWKVAVKKLFWPRLFRLADQVIVPSSGTRELMLSLGLPGDAVTLTPYCVENDWWMRQSKQADRAAVRASWGIPSDDTVFVFSGKLQPWKSPQDLLRAFAQANLSNAHLVFAGDGPLRQQLEAEAAWLDVASRVCFLGFVNQSQLPAVYAASDLLVLPSEYEPFGVVVNEAMCCGCVPVASARCGSARDLVAPVSPDLVFQCGNVGALAKILREVASNRARLQTLAHAARAHIETWSPRENIVATVEAIKNAVAHRRSRSSETTTAASAGHPAPSATQEAARMKLLVYSHFFAPCVGGVETIVQSLARGLSEPRAAKGAAVFDVTLVTQTPAGSYNDAALPFHVVRRPSLLQLWRLIRSSDVVHVAGPALAPLLFSRLARKPLVIEHHGYQAVCPNGLLFHHPSNAVCPGHFQAGNYLECMNCNAKIEGSLGALKLLAFTFLRRALSRRAAANIAPSRHVAGRQAFPRTTVIFHGVADPSRGADANKETLAGENRSFAYLGRLVVEKGVSVLLDAARLLRAQGRSGVQVLIIGDGPARPRLQNQITASHLESCVHITGFLAGDALERELRAVSTIVIPTIMDETAGLAALEQMARGRAVIASAVGGLQEIVAGTGLTFPARDASALAAAMRRILDEPGLASTLGALARQRVLQSFSLPAMIDAHARLYRGLFPSTNTQQVLSPPHD